MSRGPEQQRLRDYLDTANQASLRGAARQWAAGHDLLQDISVQLERMSGDMATSDDEEFEGATATATRMSFRTSAKAMADKADQLRQGADAFDDSATALDTAIAERDALAQNDGAQPPTRPTTPPGSTEPADVRAQADYDTANAAYWDRYRADEQRATDAMTTLDTKHTAAGQVFKSIHGEPDPVSPGGGGGGVAAGGGGGVPATGGPGGPGTGNPTYDPKSDFDPPDNDNDGGDDTDHDPPVPDVTDDSGSTDDPTPGDPAGPTGTTTLPTSPGVTGSSTPTMPGSGGVGGAAAGGVAAGGVAAGVGVGVVGGLTGGLAGGLAFPGTVAGTAGGPPGGRGIGAGGTRGAGSSVLGRGTSGGVAGVGNGAGSNRGSGRAAGRAGIGGNLSGRSGTGRGTGGRGAPGSRGMLGAAGSGRGKDKRRKDDEHELFDDGQDWLDDDGAYDSLID